MRILFLTRVHPPIVGGLENQSYNLITNFKKINKETFVIKNTRGKKALPVFLPYAYLKAISLIKKHKIAHLHLSDGVLAPIGVLLKRKTSIKVAVTIHGLDITYQNKFYQKHIPKAVAQLDKIICISENTKKECLKRGIPKSKIIIVPNGVNVDEFFINKSKKELRQKLEKRLKINFENKKILFTSGRLVKRKGVAWFVDAVMPKLGKNYVYFVAGDGEMKEEIKKAIVKRKLNNVFMLGRVESGLMNLLYNSSDLFIMPNIRVKGNVEGFGLVAIEAGSCGFSVVSSRVDGIPAAVIEGKTGWLVKEKDAESFIKKIKGKSINARSVRDTVRKYFDWKTIIKKYAEVMK